MAKSKTKTTFFCQNCGAQHPKWMGKCPNCNQWNTIVEEVVQKEVLKAWHNSRDESGIVAKPFKIDEIVSTQERRMKTHNEELDRVLGGGIVPGSLILLGGEPGIGKSTLMLQFALSISHIKTLYVSGEESLNQIKMRAERIGLKNDNLYLMAETKTENIFNQIKDLNPNLLVVDSIQTLQTQNVDSSPGSVSQIRECTAELLRYAKETSTPVLLIGHITKDGNIAGPKILEHMVDVVLQFEGDRNHLFRILRGNKNRFGSTQEIGIYEMYGAGLREVKNPSELLISNRDDDLSGNSIAATLEGARPMMIEIQALVSSAVYGTPQRSTTGFDLKRLNMLLAVLEKRNGFRLGAKDVFLNITGGIKVDDPAIDLAVVAAILSSNEDISISSKVCFAAEVGLSGEIRPVNRIEQRISEAEKLGFEVIFISKYNKIKSEDFKIRIVAVSKMDEVFMRLFS
jgi:DNA repair protein RadA/Sms